MYDYQGGWRVEHEVTIDKIIRVYISANRSTVRWEDWTGDPALLTLLPQHRWTRDPL